MITDFLSSAFFRLKAPFRARPKIDIDDVSSFLKHSRGVIHVGANKGQERYLYDSLGLDVLWIEPIPTICKRLRRNVAGFRKQRVLEALLLDQPGTQVVLHVANNGGASSSIFDFKLHTDIWPDVRYTHDLPLTSKTLPGLLHESGIEVGRLRRASHRHTRLRTVDLARRARHSVRLSLHPGRGGRLRSL